MLHFCPCEPVGQLVSVAPSIVHFCEHTGDASMLIESVHTPLAHSVDVSDTTVHGAHCLRVAICNHRTRRDDLDLLVNEIVRLGHQVLSASRTA